MKYSHFKLNIFALLITSNLKASSLAYIPSGELRKEIKNYEITRVASTYFPDEDKLLDRAHLAEKREFIYSVYYKNKTPKEASYLYRVNLGEMSSVIDKYGAMISWGNYTLKIRLREFCKTDKKIKSSIIESVQKEFPEYTIFIGERSKFINSISIEWVR